MKTALLYRPGFVFLYLIIIGLAIYSPVLDGDFICDDYVFLAYNHAIRHFPDLKPIWASFPTRFLAFVTFAVNYRLHGFHVLGYHLVNILIHILNSFLVYVFVRYLGQSKAVQRVSARPESLIAFWAALVFLCHPIQTQGVAYIFQRANSLATLFYLLTVVLYLKSRCQESLFSYGLAVGTFLCAIFCKEMAVTLPGALFLCELFFLEPSRKEWKTFALRVLPFLLLCGLLLGVFAFARVDEGGLTLNNQVSKSRFSPYFFLTEVNVLRTYLRLLVFPVFQRFEYDYPVVMSFAEFRTWLSAGLLLGLMGYAGYLFRRNRILSFCVCWYFLTTAIEVVVVSLVHRALLFEHWLYLPMVGFAIFLVAFLYDMARGEERFKRIGFILILSLCIMTVLRNQIWRDEVRFWEYEAARSPNRISVHYAAGVAYDRKGRTREALRHYQRAAELDARKDAKLRLDATSIAKIYNNIGIIHARFAETERAEKAFQKALTLDSLGGGVNNNLGMLYYHAGQYEQAVEFLRRALKEGQGDNPETWESLGRSLTAQGSQEQGREALLKARELFAEQKLMSQARRLERVLKFFPEGRNL
ncbi:MAG: tetratricopeptide repeat protein [Candidatus Omnitrophota bacterium]|jgi:Flp pilus assembly protein TadD